LIFSRVVGMTFSGVCGGLWGGGGDFGERLGNAWRLGHLQHGMLSRGAEGQTHPCTVRPCGDGRSGSSSQIRVTSRQAPYQNCRTTRTTPLEMDAKLGRKFFRALSWTLLS